MIQHRLGVAESEGARGGSDGGGGWAALLVVGKGGAGQSEC